MYNIDGVCNFCIFDNIMTKLDGKILEWSVCPVLLIDGYTGAILASNAPANKFLLRKKLYNDAGHWKAYLQKAFSVPAGNKYFGERMIWWPEVKNGQCNDETYTTTYRRTTVNGKEAYFISIEWWGEEEDTNKENNASEQCGDDVTIFEAPTIIAEQVDGRLHFVTMNWQCRQLTGLAEKRVLQEMILFASMITNLAEAEQLICAAARNHRDAFIIDLKLNNGAFLHLQARVAAIARSGWKETLMLELNDVSEFYAYKLREEITADLLDSITVVFMATDKKWRLTHVNSAAERLYGIKRDEVIGRLAWDVFPKVPDSIFYPGYIRCMNEQVPVVIEGLSPTSGRWVRSYAYPTHNGLAVFFTDITERKQMSDAIIEHSDNLDSLINNTQDMIWSVDTNHNLLIANNSYLDLIERLSGVRLAVGQYSLIAELGEQYVTEKHKQYDRALAGESFTVIKETLTGDEIRYFETNFNPIKNAAGVCTGVSCFSRDITTAKVALKTIMHQNEVLRDIAWIQSHKVRGPLSTILGLLLLIEEPVIAGDGLDVADAIKQKAEELDAIVREINEKSKYI